MIGVLAARITELRKLKTASGGLLVLGRRVIPVFAVRALKSDNFAHWILPFKFGQPPRLASSVFWIAPDTPRRRA